VPELPDIELYLHALEARVVGQPLLRLRLRSPFLLRTVEPKPAAFEQREVTGLSRIGKRIVFAFEGDRFAVLHLMIAGRLQWKKPDAPVPKRNGLAAFDFPEGSLILTEASKKKRARLHLVEGAAALEEHDPGGLEPLAIDAETFARRLRLRNHTLKRALTDPRLFSGIGNAYSDEILWEAQLSPIRWTQRMDDAQAEALHGSTVKVLERWRAALQAEVGDGWPKKVTAFRPEMAVHGKYGEPCPRCGEPVQRIRYASSETNYCATCQNGGKLLADRSLSRLLKGDWPRTLEELEEQKRARSAPADG
jgi:formamidopyrimidine-DNA glycosylase